jgi:hypothetical protein
MGHGLFGGLKNIGSDYFKMNCYVEIIHTNCSIIYPGKNYLVQLFFKEIIHYLKCHPFSNRCDNKLYINLCNISIGIIAVCYFFHA